jgi:hypothetical protein
MKRILSISISIDINAVNADMKGISHLAINCVFQRECEGGKLGNE